MKFGSLSGTCIAWQRDYSLWRIDALNRTHWGQRRTQVWLGKLYACFMWPLGRIVGILALASLIAASASAQSVHECDKTPPLNVTVAHATITVGFCFNGQDTDKQKIAVTAFEISVDGSVTTWANPTPVNQTANAQGQLYFEAPPIAVNPGTHSVSVMAVAAARKSLPSTVFAFSSALPPPTIVIGVRAR